jgi:hypothetical protein
VATTGITRVVETWNKKLHIYIGLYFLLFLWLFGLSGLFLNHPPWFHGGGPQRSSEERAVEFPAAGSDQQKAVVLAQQLGLTGEVLTARFPPRPGHFLFRVFRPNRLANVDVDIERKTAMVGFARGAWNGVLENLHTFSGVREIWGEARPERDWLATSVWSFSMDALAAGLVFLVLSSLYMWWQLRDKRLWGALALFLGCAAAVFFLWGLQRL